MTGPASPGWARPAAERDWRSGDGRGPAPGLRAPGDQYSRKSFSMTHTGTGAMKIMPVSELRALMSMR